MTLDVNDTAVSDDVDHELDHDEFDDADRLHLTQEGVELVQRRDADGKITALREATERYAKGDLVGGDSLVVLVAMYGIIFGNQELVEEAKATKQTATASNN